MKLLVCYLMIFGFYSCRKDAIPLPIHEVDAVDSLGYHPDFEMVWIKQANREQICRGTFVYDEGVVFFTQSLKSAAKDEIVALDKITGDTLWVWDEGPFYTNHRHISGNILYFSAGTSVYAINCLTGKTQWEYVPPNTLAYMSLSISSSGIYVSYQLRDLEPLDYITILFELDRNGHATEVCRLNARDRKGYTFNFDHVTPWYHPSGDKILVCESRSWNYGPDNDGIGEYVAINQSTGKIYYDWGNIFETIDIGGKALIKDDIAYISSGWADIAAINLKTCHLVWRNSLPNNMGTASLMPVFNFSDKLYLSVGNRGHLNVFDRFNGNLVKTINDVGSEWFGTSFKQHNDHLLFTSTAGLFKIGKDAEISAFISTDDLIGLSAGSFTNGMDIDPQSGYIYSTRGNHFLCIKQRQ